MALFVASDMKHDMASKSAHDKICLASLLEPGLYLLPYKTGGAVPQARNEFRPAVLMMHRAHKLAQRALALSSGTEHAEEGAGGQARSQLDLPHYDAQSHQCCKVSSCLLSAYLLPASVHAAGEGAQGVLSVSACPMVALVRAG